MSDNKTLQTSDKTSAKASSNKPTAQAATQQNPKAIKWLAISALALSVASTGFFQYRTELLSQDNAALKQHLSLLTEQNQQQMQLAAKQENQLTSYQENFKAMQAHLNFMGRTLDQIPGAKVDDWKLAEVEYLLRLANQRIILQQELGGATALLDSANQILAQLDDPSLLIIREQIAKEMLALGQFQQIDRQGIYVQIQALKNAVPKAIQLPSQFKPNKQAVQTNLEATPQESTDWLEKTKAQLLSLVRIRHNEHAFDTSLTDGQYQLLEHSLLLMLEQAQWALLKADQTLYAASLDNAANWIEKKLRHGNALALLKDIKALKKVNITQANPDISKSLSLLRQAQVNRTYAPSPIKEPAKNPIKKPEEKTKSKATPTSTAPKVNKQEQA